MVDCLFKDLRFTLSCGCQVLGMDCSDIKVDVDVEDKREAAVYFAYNPSIDNNSPFYYGSTKYFNSNKPKQSRPCSSQHQMHKYLNKDSKIYVMYGLTLLQAKVLESFFIRNANKPLSKKGSDVLEKGHLLNKRFEKMYERLIEKYIIYNGNNPFSFA